MKNNSFWVSFFSLVLMLLFLGFGGKGLYYSLEKFYKHTSLVLNGVKTEGHITSYTESKRRINIQGSIHPLLAIMMLPTDLMSIGCSFGQPIFVAIKKIVKKIFNF
ncbi:hypothetical protein [Chryseobacterium contaminans]|nr:hypothetical protein [Chryseobacterium contaminans]SHL45991.1 hypothetical protein SAMN05444407_104109 [Chryseobacterium contaminans]